MTIEDDRPVLWLPPELYEKLLSAVPPEKRFIPAMYAVHGIDALVLDGIVFASERNKP